MEQNVIEPQFPQSVDLDGDGDNKYIKPFVELQKKWSFDFTRQDKMEEIQEDKDILENLTKRVNTNISPNIKPSLYFKLMRIYDIQASDIPKTSAKKAGKSDVDMAIANAVK